ncbi:MAG: hypothetical protein Q9168_004460 [Polycauliona sp. 1 TL-2023]
MLTLSTATDVEHDSSRRKRRKTNSPQAQTPAQERYTTDDWEGQLRAAAQSRPSSPQTKLTPVEGSSSRSADEASNNYAECLASDPQRQKHTNTSHVPSMQLKHPGQLSMEDTLISRKGTGNNKTEAGELPMEVPEVGADVSAQSTGVRARPVPKATSSPKPPRRSTRLPDDRLHGTPIETNSEQAPRKMIKVRADGRLTSPKSSKLQSKSLVVDTDESPPVPNDVPRASRSPQTESIQAKNTAPKRLMKIRPDGKLASPNPNLHTPPDGPEKKRRGRPKKPVDTALQRIVVLKYGKTDGSTVSTGQKIQLILSDSSDSPPPSVASYAATKPVESIKTTHPFFLGKIAKKSEPEYEPADCKVTSDQPSNPTKQTSPRKSAVKSSATPWACFGAFGQTSSMLGGAVTRNARGTVDAIWPPQGMVHTRQISETDLANGYDNVSASAKSPVTKLKNVKSRIAEKEEILDYYTTLAKSYRMTEGESARDHFRPESLRIPSRRVMEGSELQRVYRKRFSTRPPVLEESTDKEIEGTNELSSAWHERIRSHPALLRLYDRIATCRTAFDRFEYESRNWQQKYAPTRAEEVLQTGREPMILRDWLRSLAVNSIETGSNNAEKVSSTSAAAKKQSHGFRKKKRHRAEELDGFIVSSDEEANEMGEIESGDPSQPRNEGKRTEIRAQEAAALNDKPASGQKSANAVVVSGPCGCGKTAAIYAATQELGFEVFEINAGSRRSGRDIIDKVGDMSRNHLVNQTQAGITEFKAAPAEDLLRTTTVSTQNVESGRQGTMNAFLQPKKVKKRSPKKSKVPKEDDAHGKQSTQKSQKQSVILLEEVDVLFEEDRQFWTTTLELIVQSRRPVILTCTNESLLPLDDLPLFGVLRFRKPPEQLAEEYLSLLACNEGHLLSSGAVSALYKAKGRDLRASITELQFFCQMGIGDTKGGLEWLLIEPAAEPRQITKQMRVVSDGTYAKGMGWVNQERAAPGSGRQINEEVDQILGVCNDWGIDMAEQDGFLPLEAFSDQPSSPEGRRRTLRSLDVVYDALSAADTFGYSGFRDDLSAMLEVDTPRMSEKQRASYAEGSTLLEADTQSEPLGVTDSIASALRILGRRTLLARAGMLDGHALGERSVTDALPRMVEAKQSPGRINWQKLRAIFLPLSKPSIGSSAGRAPGISSLDSQVAVVVEDIAPYVRSIVSYDLRLEEHRKQLELAFHGQRSSKRARTTRASRAALEGGSKANTRRERWFPGNIDVQAVLESGGVGWQEAVSSFPTRVAEAEVNDDSGASRRLSVGSIESMGSAAQ